MMELSKMGICCSFPLNTNMINFLLYTLNSPANIGDIGTGIIVKLLGDFFKIYIIVKFDVL